MAQDFYRHAKHWRKVFSSEFAKESDRACVVLTVAMLDHALETLLKAQLVATSAAEDELLEGAYKPISTFNAKIDLAYRLGLISAQFCRDLHTIRKIRNDFAHNIQGCTFDDPSVRSRVIELSRSSSVIEAFPKTRQGYPSGCRGDFQMIMSWMLWHLWCLVEQTTAIEPATSEIHYQPTDVLRKMVEEAEKAPES